MGEATGVDHLTTIRHDDVRAFRPGPLCTAMMASRRLPYIYVQNWKCGCSTVKNTLWNIEHSLGLSARPGYPHQEGDDSPFVADQARWEQLEHEFIFTIVRNPYSRVLSGYLDQIARHRNKQAWGQFALRHGLSGRIPTFREFLLLLAETPHGEMNPHWRPQYCNVAPKLIPYDFIGAMENLAEDLPYALGQIFRDGLAQHDCVGHQTGASSKLREYYGPTEIELVQRIYEEDFSSLGYGMDPTVLQRAAETARPEAYPLLAWGRANRHLNAGRYDEALADLGLVHARVSGPPVDESDSPLLAHDTGGRRAHRALGRSPRRGRGSVEALRQNAQQPAQIRGCAGCPHSCRTAAQPKPTPRYPLAKAALAACAAAGQPRVGKASGGHFIAAPR